MRDEAITPEAVAAFQRDEHIPTGFSPARHIVQSVLLSGTIAAVAGYFAQRAALRDWLLVPLFVMAGNVIEWSFHKNPMHRPVGPRILYKNHTLIHHRAFLPHSMPMRHGRDLGLILMPWYTMLLLFVLASPVAVAAYLWRGAGAAGIFYLTAVGYYLCYEGLHGLYHTSEALQRRFGLHDSTVFQFLLSHHRHHHRLDRMSHVNFNVTFPMMDSVMRTREAEDRPPVSASEPAPPRVGVA